MPKDKLREKKLGRGLKNLLDNNQETLEAKLKEGIIDVDLKKIKFNPVNPRKKFNSTAIEELSKTIEKYGLLQPILVQQKGEQYIVISGERRLRACILLKKKKIPCIVKEVSEQENLEIALIENIQREQLDPIEEASVYKSLLDDYHITQQDLSYRLGKNRSTIANKLRLLELPIELQLYLSNQSLTEGQLRPLIGIKNTIQVKKIAKQIIDKNLSAREVEELIKSYKTPQKNHLKSKINTNTNIIKFVKQLEEKLGTKVQIQNNKENKGKIVIHYFSLEDFERVFSLFK